MRNLFLGILAVLIFVSCDSPTGNREEDLNGQSSTLVQFYNYNNQFWVSVFPWYDRIPCSKIVLIEGKSRSEKFEFDPHPRRSFFPRFHFVLKDVIVEDVPFSFYFDPPQGFDVMIQENQTTRIPIPQITEFVSADTPLVSDVYLQIRNNSTSLINLARGGDILATENGSYGINANDTALFRIPPWGNYWILYVGQGVYFPPELTLHLGHFYSLEFDGFAVTLTRCPVVINLRNAQWGGDGSPAHPFRIDDRETLRRIGLGTGDWHGDWSLSAHYRLTADIAPAEPWTPIGGVFNGTFDGNGRSLVGLSGDLGMFNVIGSGGVVKNLVMENVAVENVFPHANLNVGAVAGVNYGTVENVVVSGRVNVIGGSGNVSIGGVVGRNMGTGTVQNSHVAADVGGVRNSGNRNVGGVAGWNQGAVQNSSVAGNVDLVGVGVSLPTEPFRGNVGGAVGLNGGTVRNVSVGGNVGANVNVSRAVPENADALLLVGGVVGHNFGNGLVERSYSAGNVAANVNVGGQNSAGYAGGVVGWNDGTVRNCFALNRSVTATGGVTGAGRVAGICEGTLAGNRAWNDMTVNGNLATYVDGATTARGDDMPMAEIRMQNTWRDAGFGFTPGGPWVWRPGFMPHPSGRGTAWAWPNWLD